jgi:hypothetical protein
MWTGNVYEPAFQERYERNRTTLEGSESGSASGA